MYYRFKCRATIWTPNNINCHVLPGDIAIRIDSVEYICERNFTPRDAIKNTVPRKIYVIYYKVMSHTGMTGYTARDSLLRILYTTANFTFQHHNPELQLGGSSIICYKLFIACVLH